MSIGLACFIIYVAGVIIWLAVCGYAFAPSMKDEGELLMTVISLLWPAAVIVGGVALIGLGAFTLGEYARKKHNRMKGGA